MIHNFDKAFNLMLDLEGGYTLHKNPTESTSTFAGIYKRYHQNWEGWDYIDQGKNPPKELVKTFYKTEFWDKVKGDELPAGVDITVFDFAVNSAPSDAIKALQEVIGTKVDGVIGKATLGKIKEETSSFHLSSCNKLIEDVSALRIYHMMKGNKQDLALYGKGWARRVCNVMSKSLTEMSPF